MSSTVHPTITEWLVYLEEQGRSESTVANYCRGLRHFVDWSEHSYGQVFDPARIIPRDVSDWKSYQQTVEKARPSTINLRLVALSRYFEWAVSRGYARTDPTVEVSGLRLDNRRPRALDETAIRRLLRQVYKEGNLRDIALVELMLGTGLRVSEVLALKVGDVILKDRSGEVIVRRGKGGLYRRVPLTAPVRKALLAYRESRPGLSRDDYLWVGERGPLRDRGGVLYVLKKYAFQAGLDESLVSPHVLRHCFATRYLAANPDDLRGLAAILGHANLNTVTIYTEPTTEDLAVRMARAEVTE